MELELWESSKSDEMRCDDGWMSGEGVCVWVGDGCDETLGFLGSIRFCEMDGRVKGRVGR